MPGTQPSLQPHISSFQTVESVPKALLAGAGQMVGTLQQVQLTVHLKLLIADTTLHTLHNTGYTVHNTLQTAHCKLHTAHCTIYTAHCPLHAVHFTLHTAHSTFYTEN